MRTIIENMWRVDQKIWDYRKFGLHFCFVMDLIVEFLSASSIKPKLNVVNERMIGIFQCTQNECALCNQQQLHTIECSAEFAQSYSVIQNFWNVTRLKIRCTTYFNALKIQLVHFTNCMQFKYRRKHERILTHSWQCQQMKNLNPFHFILFENYFRNIPFHEADWKHSGLSFSHSNHSTYYQFFAFRFNIFIIRLANTQLLSVCNWYTVG